MATIVLQAAGAFIGGVFGPVGSAIGSAIGSMVGYSIDRNLLESTRHIEGARLSSVRPFQAEEGVQIPRAYGTVKVGGSLIWATRFEETRTTERQGGKGGGPRVTNYTYFCNAAFVLCEGEIAGVRRIWADGREIDLETVNIRIHRGHETQAVDPLIAAKQGAGNAPAYRGVAYAVLEHFPLANYGNRIPQFQFEVMRPVGTLNKQIKSVALLPGSTEYGLSPHAVTRMATPGVTAQVNRNVLHARSDIVASLDELQALCPNLEEVAIIATWFGNDLRAGECTIKPKVTHHEDGFSEPWSVAGIERSQAEVVSYVDGAASYGGTPSDQSVIECIAEVKSRGLRVALYPFIMMDVPPENSLPNPYGGTGQAAFPWRGRITCMPAPQQSGTADKTRFAREQVQEFAGNSMNEWGYRNFIHHYAQLVVRAGGVDTFLLGSEMRGLTTLRDQNNAFPFVELLCNLAQEVRAALGGKTAITYGADWSEYFGYQPADGSGDVFFHLDELWAHEAISAVGIDNYMPLSDWQDVDYVGGNPDGFAGPYDNIGLRSQIAAGEGYDWYYANPAAREARIRTPITDGEYNKPWVFRYKDIRSWWKNPHYNRIAGVEQAQPTAWIPQSKPIWFTELGCPAVDKGANQPNVFPDAKSSEDATPYFSSGGRSDLVQRRFLQAHFDHWHGDDDNNVTDSNPVSPIYGGSMVDPSRICLWAWDARPFPAFPQQSDYWRDGENWQCGHWLNGRLSGLSGQDLVAAILADHGMEHADTSQIGGSMVGYLVESPTTARASLEPFLNLFGVVVRDENGRLIFQDETAFASAPIAVRDMVLTDEGAVFERTRKPDHELPSAVELTFVDPFQDYQAALVRCAKPGARTGDTHTVSFPGYLESGAASSLLADWLERRHAARDTISFSLPAISVDINAGTLISLKNDSNGYEYIVTETELGLSRKINAKRIKRTMPAPWRTKGVSSKKTSHEIAGKPHVLLLDLPMLSGSSTFAEQLKIAAFAKPWRSQAIYSSPEQEGFSFAGLVSTFAVMGELLQPLSPGPCGRFDRYGQIKLRLYGGELASVSTLRLLNGANVGAVRAKNGVWEILQFSHAEEIEAGVWVLSHLLRGQAGTNDATYAGTEQGAPFVLLDEAIVKAGLLPEQAGLSLNWRVGPATHDPGSTNFVQITNVGGVRARLPLSPVHLKAAMRGNGDCVFRWIRRGRVDADSWMAEEIPLGEETEHYRIDVSSINGTRLRSHETSLPVWTYTRAHIEQDFSALPAQVEVAVRQISATVGAGMTTRKIFNLL